MKQVILSALLAASLAVALLGAQSGDTFRSGPNTVKFDAKGEYALTVENQSPAAVNQWWSPFQQQHTLEGYCFELGKVPVSDRPQIGDKASLLKMGGAGQMVQVIEIPPSGKTTWHGYGWEGEALFYVISGRGQTEYKSPGGLPTNKYTWKKNSMFSIPVDHQIQHTNLDPAQSVRLLAVTGYAINMFPYVEEAQRYIVQNKAESEAERTRTLLGTTYPGHFVDDLREHPVAMREARGNRTAFFNMMATIGHRTHPNIHISELTGPQAYAHKHGDMPMFVILKGAGYDLWSEARSLTEYEAAVKEGKAHRADYQVGTICGVPGGPHWHQHFSTSSEQLRYLAIVPRGDYEEKPAGR